jgi:hypothetical protein
MAKPKLNLIDPASSIVLENFKRIDKAWANEGVLKFDWKFFELSFASAVSNYKHPHFLKYIPTDIIQTSKIGVGDVTWNHNLFTRTHIDLSVTGACTVRFLVGRYEEGDI